MILLPIAALFAATNPAPEAERTDRMQITRKDDMKTVDGPAEYFTGKATITG